MFALIARPLIFGIAILLAGPAQAQSPATVPPERVKQLFELLDDPSVKAWMAEQRNQDAGSTAAPARAETSPANASSDAVAAPGQMNMMASSTLDRIKHHIERIVRTLPLLPGQFARVRAQTMEDMSSKGPVGVLVLIAIFIAVGVALTWATYRLTRPFRLWIIAQPKDTPIGRAKKIGGRTLYSSLLIVSFALGSAGAFMLFDWPMLIREIVLTFLMAAVVTAGVRMYLAAMLVPSFMQVENAVEVRALPVTNETADHWFYWIPRIVGVFAFFAAAFNLLPGLGIDQDGMMVLSLGADFVMLFLWLLAIWRRPRTRRDDGHGHTAATWLLTAYFVVLFLERIAGLYTWFWFTFAAFVLPLAIVLTQRGVNFVLRPGSEDVGRPTIPAVTIAVIDRGIRMILILAAAYLLARVWGLDMQSMRDRDTTTMLILSGLINVVVIALAADFGWSIIKALIERKLGIHTPHAVIGEEGILTLDPHQARLHTLLPIIQNILLAVIIVMAVLMMLASIGIQIGPLIAGAGVVGVAVGFGAQTIVKDVISGVFYLLDDAFRVGEYISSGSYRGTVESFSLRSVKLRHHRGPLFTIPFGELGAVQNQSRDWVTDKFNVTVGYDTDIELARKLIKRIGLELAEDPEFKHWVIEPIKMQGVQEFGEYGIVLRVKVTTRPGGAFSMKGRFFLRLRQAFKEQGIELPFPTVHIQGMQNPHEAENAPLEVTPELRMAVAQSHTNRRRKKAGTTE
ncbi:MULTISPECIES: mechanosensitive ion channel family protein [Mesorhizobium]|uniref:Small-conductance mechanosensitive channel n=2 Tax=Mesorhizobium TaxID=68287 RepID=A0A1A5IWT9_RHILI|nr:MULTISPECIES: mechanosensitive ion channel family protein [Mesorhizobium]MBE1706845.1 mechanosensitive ion channel family protein [Mesorhizobium japonicum]MBE1716256.1 mechanosensitive ion channel family protein [Mesorhizobium japonicum]MUT20934.1 mechanosensitive ion channel [Mesorhizobium japonicum]MUT31202.1 mechanosensitive ion channel [Mesorhizobium japonicum]OBP80762.1 small-conductance mechanosensitive channel [Mesorhizobium loti]